MDKSEFCVKFRWEMWIMDDDFAKKVYEIQNVNNEALPVFFEEEPPKNECIKIPFDKIGVLGTSFEPIASIAQTVLTGQKGTSGVYRVTVPKGMHLAKFKNGAGHLGACLNANNQVAGQAVLNPMKIDPTKIDPTMLFMAVALASLEKKLDCIQEMQKEMMDFLVQKEKSELRGNLIFLSDIMNNYRYNWNNDMYKNTAHIKVFDIKQDAEQKIIFYKEQIVSELQKGSYIHGDRDARKRIEKARALLNEYRLALYLYGFASFLDVMLVSNFEAEYLNGIVGKIQEHIAKYKDLYTECYDKSELYYNSSVQSTLLRGLKNASKAAGEAMSESSVWSKHSMNEALLNAGNKLEQKEEQRTETHMQRLAENQDDFITPFVEGIELLKKLYENDISIMFDYNGIYFLGENTEDE